MGDEVVQTSTLWARERERERQQFEEQLQQSTQAGRRPHGLSWDFQVGCVDTKCICVGVCCWVSWYD